MWVHCVRKQDSVSPPLGIHLRSAISPPPRRDHPHRKRGVMPVIQKEERENKNNATCFNQINHEAGEWVSEANVDSRTRRGNRSAKKAAGGSFCTQRMTGEREGTKHGTQKTKHNGKFKKMEGEPRYKKTTPKGLLRPQCLLHPLPRLKIERDSHHAP